MKEKFVEFYIQKGTKTDGYGNLFAFGWVLIPKCHFGPRTLEVRLSILFINFIVDIRF